MPARKEKFVAVHQVDEEERARQAHPVAGWPLAYLARLDREGARGLVADLTLSGPLTRQAAYIVAAALKPEEVTAFLTRLGIGVPGAEGIGIALRRRHARDVIAATFSVAPQEVPTGYLRAVARIEEKRSDQPGIGPFTHPGSYATLFRVFTDERQSRKAHALRYCGAITSIAIEAVESLNPLLVWPEVIRAISTQQQVCAANALLDLIRALVSTSTDEKLILAMRRSLASRNVMDVFARKALEQADSLPTPPFPPADGLRPLTSAADLREFGERMHNCATNKLAECALGLMSIYEARHTTEDGKEYVLAVTLAPLMDGSWTVADIKGPKNRQPPVAASRAVLENFRALGALIPGPPLQSRYRSDLAQLLGAYRWGAIDDVLRDPNEADLDALDGLEDALSEVA